MAVAKYVGDGGHYHGIPARDLDAVDWERLTEAQQRMVRVGNLYELVEQRAKARSARKSRKEK